MKNKLLLISLLALIGASCNSSSESFIDSSVSSESSISSESESSESSSVTSSSESSETIILSVPQNIAYSDRVVSWDAVENATGYNVKINESIYEVTITSYELVTTLFGSFDVSVQATSGTNHSSYSGISSFSAIIHLPVPTNFHQEGETVVWDAVESATGYMVKINEVEHLTLETTYPIDSLTPTAVSVKATGRVDQLIISSAYSQAIQIKGYLSAPTGLVFNSGTLTWDAVSNATGYSLTINQGVFSSATNTYEIGYQFVGEVEIIIVALGGENYYDSEPTTWNLNIFATTLATPINLALESNILSFDSVEFAEGYSIYVDGLFYDSTLTNSYTIEGELLLQLGSYIQVMATSSTLNSSALSLKIYLGMIEISTEEELRAISTLGAYILTADIVLTTPWTPIAFEGQFDGNGHNISGIVIQTNLIENVGFFSLLNQAIIHDMHLTGTITLTNMTSFEPHVGGLAGTVVDSQIDQVVLDFSITAVSNNGVGHLGGAIGHLVDTNLSNISVSTTIETTNFITGGLVGIATSEDSSTTLIFQSRVLGVITVNGGEQSIAGGFIGRLTNNSLTISQSRTGVTLSGPTYVGGFVGYMGTGTIENCYSYGSVVATNTTIAHAGGFIGRMEGYNNSVSFCISMSSVSTSFTGAQIFKGAFVGTTPGGSFATLYSTCHFDNTICTLDRIGNTTSGRGDGITGLSTSALLLLSTYNLTIWNFSLSAPILVWEMAS